MKRKPPPKRTVFQRMCDVGDVVGCVDELMQEGGFSRTDAFAVAADILCLSESTVRNTYRAHKKHYPIDTPDVRVSRIVRGPQRPAVLTFVATGQRVTEDPLLPFERLLGHPLGVALLMEMTVYPTEESCLAKLEAGGVRCTKCRGDQVKRRSKHYWWCAACGKQSNPAKVKAGKVHCTHCDGDRVTGRPGHHWWCATCRRQFSSLTGTPMEATHLPLRLWTAAIFLKLLSRDTITAKEGAELLGVTRATAGNMLDALRTKVAS
jgi:transposase-like protein